MVFKDGQELKALILTQDGKTISVGMRQVISIKVVMQNGQMDLVPWFLVTFENHFPCDMYNAALVAGVELYKEGVTP